MSQQQLETRPLELRVEPSGKIVGTALTYRSLSRDLGGFLEEFEAGAFTESLRSGEDVRALVEHDPSKILGSRSSGTLQLRDDAQGLHVEITPAKTTFANDARELIASGIMRGMSFGFRVRPGGDKWARRSINGQDVTVRTVSAAEIREVTITATPAYADTSVALRSLEEARAADNQPRDPSGKYHFLKTWQLTRTKSAQRFHKEWPADEASQKALVERHAPFHRRAVQRALLAGKPVPEEVLAEYPGLAESAVKRRLLDLEEQRFFG